MEKIYLKENWKLLGAEIGTLDAEVPGCVHTDLINHGIIKDIFWRDNNQNYQWIENCDFTYTCLFDGRENTTAALVFEGLDTYCDIYLNGEKIGSANNMFIPYSFDVSGKLKAKDNLLEVKFRSPIKEIEGLPLCEGAFTRERIRTRRIQCTYGWDWVDRFVTSGIWRPVYIEYGEDMYVDSAYIVTQNIDEYSAQMYIELELANYQKGSVLNIEILSPKGKRIYSADVYSKEAKIVRRVDIKNPELWYPNGYGDHPIYTLKVTVGSNVFTETFGIRTIKILQLPDKIGSEYYLKAQELQKGEIVKNNDLNESYSGFQVLVNGVKILCKGANWVPCEPFPSAESDEKFDKLISLAEEMNLNMLRVWGGGIFENRRFYDDCDKHGILVLQDFLMACGTYPEKEEWFIEELKKEAFFAVKYLRNHPCLAWWQGDNENAVDGNDFMEDYTGRDSALLGVAPFIYEYDWSRTFLPSSPYGGNTYSSITAGTTHNTNFVCDMFKYMYNTDCSDYKEFFEQFTARFINEEPVFGAVSRKSLMRFMTEDDLKDENQEILHYHTKNNPWLEREVFEYTTAFALKVLGEAENAEDRYFKYKYIQSEWTRVVFENMRRNIGYSNGMLFWMFDDCWPASLGWSFIDYYCMPKDSFYTFKRLAKHLTVSTVKSENGYKSVISNDLDMDIPVKVKAYLIDNNGLNVIDVFETDIKAKGYAPTYVNLPFAFGENYTVVCDIISQENCDRSFYKHGNLHITDCSDKIKIVAQSADSMTITSDSYIHIVELEADLVFDDNVFSLMPGEVKTINWQNDYRENEISITAYTLKY